MNSNFEHYPALWPISQVRASPSSESFDCMYRPNCPAIDHSLERRSVHNYCHSLERGNPGVGRPAWAAMSTEIYTLIRFSKSEWNEVRQRPQRLLGLSRHTSEKESKGAGMPHPEDMSLDDGPRTRSRRVNNLYSHRDTIRDAFKGSISQAVSFRHCCTAGRVPHHQQRYRYPNVTADGRG